MAVTYDGNDVTLYLNGFTLGTRPANIDTAINGGSLSIGNRGAFDEFAVYDRPLTPHEVLDRWAIGLSTDGQPCRRTPADSYGADVVESGAIRYYRFEEADFEGLTERRAIDSSSRCAPGFVASSSSADDSSPLGNSVSNINQTAVYAPSVGLPDGDSERTIEFWVNPLATSGIEHWQWVTYGDFQIRYRPFTRQIDVTSNGQQVAAWTSQEPLAGLWHHIALTYDGTDLNLYLNGENLGPRTAEIDTNLADAPLSIGPRASLDELAIYPTTLNPQIFDGRWRDALDILGIQPCAAAPTDSYGQAITNNNPVTYFRFEEVPTTSEVVQRITPDAGTICVPAIIRNGTQADDSSPLGNSVLNVDQTAVYAPSVGLPDGNSERTIEFWVNPLETSGIEHWQWVTYGDFQIRYRPFTRQIDVTSNGQQVAAWTSQEPLAGLWHHIALTYDGTDLNLYLNGENLGPRTAEIDTNLADAPLSIGPRASLDELAIYPTTLNPQELEARPGLVQ